MDLAPADIDALWLTAKLALLSTVLLLILATPLAWWLVHSRFRFKAVVEAAIALPLVLPPTVLGFYLLLAMGPNGPLGWFTDSLGLPPLTFTFSGLVIGSLLYSLPFAVQPLRDAFGAIPPRQLEAAATLGATSWQRFRTIVLPLSRSGFITAGVLSFAHTLGEFGVVLMIGGNIPGETRVASLAIYEHVEALDYAQAHKLSLILLGSCLVLLLLVFTQRRRQAPLP